MTVSEFLVLPGLPGLRLLAGAGGADRKIAAVTAVDTPDGAQRLKGGELVLTTGYMLGQQAITLPDFLRALQKAGAAGLGILKNAICAASRRTCGRWRMNWICRW